MKAVVFVVILGAILWGVYTLSGDVMNLSQGGSDMQLAPSKAAGHAVEGLKSHEAMNKNAINDIFNGR